MSKNIIDKDNLIEELEKGKKAYLVYRGSSFDKDGNLFWAKDDAMAFAEGIDAAIETIKGNDPWKKLMS